jgi:hypothetical protein
MPFQTVCVLIRAVCLSERLAVSLQIGALKGSSQAITMLAVFVIVLVGPVATIIIRVGYFC